MAEIFGLVCLSDLWKWLLLNYWPEGLEDWLTVNSSVKQIRPFLHQNNTLPKNIQHLQVRTVLCQGALEGAWHNLEESRLWWPMLRYTPSACRAPLHQEECK